MEMLYAITTGILTSCGLYLTLRGRTFPVVVGLTLLSYAVNLFLFSMLMLVFGNNLVVTFLGWEGVGACSYFLISFWHRRESAATAGKKAFVTNRVGDWGFMIATFAIWSALGTVTYTEIANSPAMSAATGTAVSLLLFVAAAGKSAQLPLYVWLPDAMEGPTPVSAMVHAATMVTSGVYLLVRMNNVLTDDALLVIAGCVDHC